MPNPELPGTGSIRTPSSTGDTHMVVNHKFRDGGDFERLRQLGLPLWQTDAEVALALGVELRRYRFFATHRPSCCPSPPECGIDFEASGERMGARVRLRAFEPHSCRRSRRPRGCRETRPPSLLRLYRHGARARPLGVGRLPSGNCLAVGRSDDRSPSRADLCQRPTLL